MTFAGCQICHCSPGVLDCFPGLTPFNSDLDTVGTIFETLKIDFQKGGSFFLPSPQSFFKLPDRLSDLAFGPVSCLVHAYKGRYLDRVLHSLKNPTQALQNKKSLSL